MQKKIKRFNVPKYLDWRFIELPELKKDIEDLEKLGATIITIDPYEEYDVLGVTIEAFSERLETDEEFSQRQSRIKHEEAIQKMEELKQLAELKAKYEK